MPGLGSIGAYLNAWMDAEDAEKDRMLEEMKLAANLGTSIEAIKSSRQQHEVNLAEEERKRLKFPTELEQSKADLAETVSSTSRQATLTGSQILTAEQQRKKAELEMSSLRRTVKLINEREARGEITPEEAKIEVDIATAGQQLAGIEAERRNQLLELEAREKREEIEYEQMKRRTDIRLNSYERQVNQQFELTDSIIYLNKAQAGPGGTAENAAKYRLDLAEGIISVEKAKAAILSGLTLDDALKQLKGSARGLVSLLDIKGNVRQAVSGLAIASESLKSIWFQDFGVEFDAGIEWVEEELEPAEIDSSGNIIREAVKAMVPRFNPELLTKEQLNFFLKSKSLGIGAQSELESRQRPAASTITPPTGTEAATGIRGLPEPSPLDSTTTPAPTRSTYPSAAPESPTGATWRKWDLDKILNILDTMPLQ